MSKWDQMEKAMAGDRRDPREEHRMEDGPSRAARTQLEEYYDRSEERSDARIQAQLGFMTEQLSITQKMFSELTNRLEPVLIPEMDDVNAIPNDPPRKMASELSNVIDDLNGQISRLQARINKVIERVQL